ncbi:DUF3352 domain-containing protein [Rhodopirellula sallentina]|uniref:Uncharacterized protein n=1 Tax=Rhodopirellula sallentina SM41 TaxID=1263870 RepID=M5U7X9_9BACT|nr:DUF3352 domain-containing protein [Rhodopirellula sallentina]EMI57379.1 hypothetical protein RSSM_01220 [Rhodopirellula sallentina SM41]
MIALTVSITSSPTWAQTGLASRDARDQRGGQELEFESAVPPASRLLPSDTYAYVRIRNVADLKVGFARSSLGQMLDDPAMQPFVSDTYQTLSATLEEFASQIGLSLDELLSIPQGQVAIALVPGAPPEAEPAKPSRGPEEEPETDEEIARRLQRQRRQQNRFAVVLMVETGKDNTSSARMNELLEQIGELSQRNQFVSDTEKIGDHSLTTWRRARGGQQTEWFQRDGMFVIGLGRRAAADVLERWNDSDAPRNRKEAAEEAKDTDSKLVEISGNLSSNPDFGSVMTRSIGAEAETPQITFFVHPYAIAEKIISRSGSAFFIMPIVETLGADKIRGIGGSIFRGGEVIEGIIHAHIVINPPRDGFFGVIRPEEVDPTPPEWVPADATSYMTAQWDIATATDNLTQIVDRFAGEGSFDRFAEDRIQARLDISLKEEVIPNLTGRYVGVQRYQLPAAWNAVARLDALQVRDVEKARELLQRAKTKLPASDMRAENVGGAEVYFLANRRKLPNTLRTPERSVFLIDDYLVLADSRELVEQVLRARSGKTPRLIDDTDYELLLSELGAKLGGEKPFVLNFARDADSYRVLYNMAGSDEFAGTLSRRGENNPVIAKFADLLNRQKLPPFDELRKYFNVSGGFGYDEPGGLHFGLMTLRPLE